MREKFVPTILKSFQIYNLGNGNIKEDQKTAYNEFIKREFPQVLDCDLIPHDPIIVPEAYLYQGMTQKVIFDLIFNLNVIFLICEG